MSEVVCPKRLWGRFAKTGRKYFWSLKEIRGSRCAVFVREDKPQMMAVLTPSGMKYGLEHGHLSEV